VNEGDAMLGEKLIIMMPLKTSGKCAISHSHDSIVKITIVWDVTACNLVSVMFKRNLLLPYSP
jgi:hypothetical protein